VHLVLTDHLTCPRCGPTFGLILLAERLSDRRVHEGHLGCPNCRDRYPIRGGFGDLRAPPRSPLGDAPAPDPVEEPRAGPLLTLLGGGREGSHTVCVGSGVRWGPALASAADAGAEFVAVEHATRTWPENPGLSRMAAAPGLPFFDRSMQGVLLHGDDLDAMDRSSGDALVAEAARIVAAGSRVVILEPPPGAAARLAEAGLPDALASSTLAAAGRGGGGPA
jgi:uncharacterized protein YbaR (Trm112 family)